jgi:hypothetical protein
MAGYSVFFTTFAGENQNKKQPFPLFLRYVYIYVQTPIFSFCFALRNAERRFCTNQT